MFSHVVAFSVEFTGWDKPVPVACGISLIAGPLGGLSLPRGALCPCELVFPSDWFPARTPAHHSVHLEFISLLKPRGETVS